MLMNFPNYRAAVCRQVYKNLRATTMQTFLKVCPKEFIKTHDVQFGLTVFINGSCIYWLHLDSMDEATAKGFEINALVIDQAEEVEESIYLLMDARVGRWDKAEVPEHLLEAYPQWPRHPKGGYPLVPNYTDVLDNPSDDEFHWVSRYYDDDSPERKEGYFSQVRATDDSMNDARTIAQLKTRDQEWLDKYYYGKKTTSKALLHKVNKESQIDPDKDFQTDAEFEAFLDWIRRRGRFYRVLDHGETAPTCCLFAAAIQGIHILIGEYYMPNETISVHRQNIYDISAMMLTPSSLDESKRDDYFKNALNSCIDIADPSIVNGTARQTKGKSWTVADEYLDEEEIKAPPITWIAADNNELATRNRINELLKAYPSAVHPVTKVENSPRIYFILRGRRWPFGIHNVLLQVSHQRKKLLGEVNGKKFYSEERDPKIEDHGYDTFRYYVAEHNKGKTAEYRKPPARSFANFNRIYKLRRAYLKEVD